MERDESVFWVQAVEAGVNPRLFDEKSQPASVSRLAGIDRDGERRRPYHVTGLLTSERYLPEKFDGTAAHRQRVDRLRGVIRSKCVVRKPKTRMVEYVTGVSADLEFGFAPDGEVFAKREVDVREARASHAVSARVPERRGGRLRKGRRVEPVRAGPDLVSSSVGIHAVNHVGVLSAGLGVRSVNLVDDGERVACLNHNRR